ncbi:MAG: 3-deoxy-D-manno-octulosonate 8-phosphate phosphatase [Archangium gephyra]|uniref:3-deoxy-D-manno-octulosonate 8-phosphate phosphatase n=1 Tax=Archangium gephyra TaxID=48 RepID=A0A2W5THA0_9BACT|nr:MAG: 3-deoxy-D-manno-octulosonate 8-phosphate phosphatase [Archangium gephyra]
MTPVERAANIKAVVFDVDGVLTDGALWYGPGGEAIKRFDVKDGHAIVLARLTSLPVAILTARNSPIVDVRARELKIATVFQGRIHKGPAFLELAEQLGLQPQQLAYMGDDVNDLPAMARAGLSGCPANAVPEVLEAVHFVSTRNGGHGAVREFIELILKATGRWDAALEHARG